MVTGPVGTGGFVVKQTQPGTGSPVTWDPCRVVHYVVSGEGPAGSEQVITDAVGEISAATGLSFVRDGGSSEPARLDRAAYQPERYGERWAPLLIAWTTPSQLRQLAGQVDGLGGSQPVRDPSGRLSYVTGFVYLDAAQLAAGPDADRTSRLRTTALHELGHAMGLDHVAERSQVMYAAATASRLGAGDRRGLAALGRGACAPGL
jgi:hypothetical protein